MFHKVIDKILIAAAIAGRRPAGGKRYVAMSPGAERC
jgi:hypothetical protein